MTTLLPVNKKSPPQETEFGLSLSPWRLRVRQAVPRLRNGRAHSARY